MATATKPPATPQDTRDEQQLRHDRITAIVMLAVMALLFALIMWLASMGNGNVESYDHWSIPF